MFPYLLWELSSWHSREQLKLWTHTTSKLVHITFLSMSILFYFSSTLCHLFYWYLSLMWLRYVRKLWKTYDENSEYNTIHDDSLGWHVTEEWGGVKQQEHLFSKLPYPQHEFQIYATHLRIFHILFLFFIEKLMNKKGTLFMNMLQNNIKEAWGICARPSNLANIFITFQALWHLFPSLNCTNVILP